MAVPEGHLEADIGKENSELWPCCSKIIEGNDDCNDDVYNIFNENRTLILEKLDENN
jgi:hypothetical protein